MLADRRRFRGGSAWCLALACLGSSLTGCETMRGLGLRPHQDSVSKVPTGSEEIEDAGVSNRQFFKPSRRPAAMSSEAREVENSLGLGGL